MRARLLAVAGVLVLVFVFGQQLAAAQPCAVPDAAALNKEVAKYKNVTVTVDDCIVHLNGQVDRLSESWDIARKFRKLDWVSGVANHLSVGGPVVEDGKLQRNVLDMVQEEGNSDLRSPLGVAVQDGVVNLSGVEPNAMMLDSMLYSVAHVKGVRSIFSSVYVDPLLNIDDIAKWTPRTEIMWYSYVGPMYPKQ
jgi:hypothetical protein